MEPNEYLKKVLEAQTLAEDGDELEALRGHREDVEKLLREHFSKCSPTIRYGGSKVKGTMIREAYDLDIICYFPHDDTAAGETLEDIYNNVRKALATKYLVEPKTSALRLKNPDRDCLGVDFHIDVVPGHFTDDTKTDAFLYQASGDKKRLKTNLDVHIAHVRDSGVTEAIRLMKLWKVRNGIPLKNFVLDLLVIELLKGKKKLAVDVQLLHVWKAFRDDSDGLAVEDPANPAGNDLTPALDEVRSTLANVARRTLSSIDSSRWESVFGTVEEKSRAEKTQSLLRIAAAAATPSRPWCPDES